MHRLILAIAALTLGACSLWPDIELGTRPLKDEGVCLSRGGLCGCFIAQAGDTTTFPDLDCHQTPLTCHRTCVGAVSFDAGGDDPGPSDPRVPRLMVANFGDFDGGSLAIWNHANAITADVSPSEMITTPGGVMALALGPKTLLLGLDGARVLVYDLPRSVSANAAPRADLSLPEVSTAVAQVLAVHDNLWVVLKSGTVFRLPGLTTLTSSATPLKVPTADGGRVDEAVFAPSLDGIYAISGPTLLQEWAPEPRPTLRSTGVEFDPGAPSHLAAAGATLFSAGSLASLVSMRGNTSLLSTFSQDGLFDSTVNDVKRLSSQHDTLIVIGYDSVALYAQASTLIARKSLPSMPDVILTDPSVSQPIDAVLGADARLYVLDHNGVSIFENALTQPVFVTKLKTGLLRPKALTLVE
jgi:hypothetical protein